MLCRYDFTNMLKKLTHDLCLFFKVFYQSWRSVLNLIPFTSPCVISSHGTVSASNWFMCPTSPTSPIRTPPTRDSCKTLSQAFVFSYRLSGLYLSRHSISLFFQGGEFRVQTDSGEIREESCLPETSSSFLPRPPLPEDHKN